MSGATDRAYLGGSGDDSEIGSSIRRQIRAQVLEELVFVDVGGLTPVQIASRVDVAPRIVQAHLRALVAGGQAGVRRGRYHRTTEKKETDTMDDNDQAPKTMRQRVLEVLPDGVDNAQTAKELAAVLDVPPNNIAAVLVHFRKTGTAVRSREGGAQDPYRFHRRPAHLAPELAEATADQLLEHHAGHQSTSARHPGRHSGPEVGCLLCADQREALEIFDEPNPGTMEDPLPAGYTDAPEVVAAKLRHAAPPKADLETGEVTDQSHVGPVDDCPRCSQDGPPLTIDQPLDVSPRGESPLASVYRLVQEHATRKATELNDEIQRHIDDGIPISALRVVVGPELGEERVERITQPTAAVAYQLVRDNLRARAVELRRDLEILEAAAVLCDRLMDEEQDLGIDRLEERIRQEVAP
ncbi:MAG: hypothetical protein GY898_23150 [Proteobacteria bacterium]|nr:hypothetical protein [Pseudomonadota bacterium]